MVVIVTMIWLTGLRTKVKAMAAPRMGSRTESGANDTIEKSSISGHLLVVSSRGRRDLATSSGHSRGWDLHDAPGIQTPRMRCRRRLRRHRLAVQRPGCLRCRLEPRHDVPEPRNDRSGPTRTR